MRALTDIPYGDSPRQRLDLFVPKGDGGTGKRTVGDNQIPLTKSGKSPLIIFFYGGGWSSGTRKGYSFIGKAFAATGCAVVVPDFGKHPDAPYPEFLEDCAKAVRWARDNAERLDADPDMIFLAGHSSGGYNAAMLALDARWLHGAGVPHDAIAGWLGLSAPYDFLPLDVAASIRTFSHVPEKLLPSTQPINKVTPGSPPAFFSNGAPDTIVGKYHVENMAEEYEKRDLTHTAKIYDGMNHYWAMLSLAKLFQSKFPVFADMLSFIRETMRTR